MRFIPIYVVSKNVGSDGLVFWGGGSKRKRANVRGGEVGEGEKVTYVCISRRGFGWWRLDCDFLQCI